MIEKTPDQTASATAAEAIEALIPPAVGPAASPANRADASGLVPPLGAEGWLESGLRHVDGGLSALFAEAKSIDPAEDPYGHARSRAYADAIGLLKVSAKVGHTVAELRGGRRFEHNINVHRSSDQAESGRRSRRAARQQPKVEEEVEYDDVEIPDGCYDDNYHLSDGRVFVHGVGWRHPHPPQETEGSNTPPPVQPRPRVRTF